MLNHLTKSIKKEQKNVHKSGLSFTNRKSFCELVLTVNEIHLFVTCKTFILVYFDKSQVGMGLFGEAVLAQPVIVAVCCFLIRKILKILGFRG